MSISPDVGPLTWFSDDFRYLLLPYEYARPGHYTKEYNAWNGRDFGKFMIPDLSEESFWIEVCVHIIFTPTPGMHFDSLSFSSNSMHSHL